ncbi:MAG: hypothetical protein MUE63_12590 [Xanthomonadales bacterium]|nr:hypothetical protein [Xanthomonadales bacterium]
MKRSSALYFSLAAALSVAACATPRTADNVTLARVAKEYIGVGSIDEMEISNVQKMPDSGSRTNYRFFVDTARKKKFICDVSLAPRMPDGKLLGNDTAKCDNR